MNNETKQFWLLLVMSGIVVAGATGAHDEFYPNKPARIASLALAGAVCTGVGYALFKGLQSPIGALLDSQAVQNIYSDDEVLYKAKLMLRGVIAAGAAFGTGALIGKTLTQGSYLFMTGKRLSPTVTKRALAELNEYLMYISILEALQKEYNQLIENLDSAKYHLANLPERLLCLDGAYYHIKEHNIIAELEKERNYHLAHMQMHLNALQFIIDRDGQELTIFKKLTKRYQKLLDMKPSDARQNALDYLQAHKKVHIYTKFTEFYTHVKLFNKGFNEGINVIDEAMKINSLARRLVDIVSFSLWDYHDSIKESIAESIRLEKLENAIASYTKRKFSNN